MNIQAQTAHSPASVHINTDRFAFSANGAAMATNGLMGCMGVVVHDPTSHTGCLGHLPPARDLSTYFARCIHLMGIADNDCANLEVVFVGGNRGGPPFAVEAATALNDNLMSAMNAYDGRRNTAAPFVGERIAEGFSVTYDPAHDTTYIGTNALQVPNYTVAVTAETLRAGLNMYEVTSAALT